RAPGAAARTHRRPRLPELQRPRRSFSGWPAPPEQRLATQVALSWTIPGSHRRRSRRAAIGRPTLTRGTTQMGTRVFIGNLSFTTTEDDLRALLSEGGRTVRDLHLPSDRETGRPRGFAFAEMGNAAEAAAAIEALDGKDFDGRKL